MRIKIDCTYRLNRSIVINLDLKRQGGCENIESNMFASPSVGKYANRVRKIKNITAAAFIVYRIVKRIRKRNV